MIFGLVTERLRNVSALYLKCPGKYAEVKFMNYLKKLLAQLPGNWQDALKRIHYSRQIRKGTFITSEPEYAVLDQFIKQDDWVIDIGANIGHYTNRFSDLVGKKGRVVAFDPVPATFSILASNARLFEYQNVTLINTALSDKVAAVGISIPKFDTGLLNYYQAHLSVSSDINVYALSLSLDALNIDHPIALIKIDAEGHEAFILNGMKKLLLKFHPTLIIETDSKDVIAGLLALGYTSDKFPDSPNILFRINNSLAQQSITPLR
jgi:FkbM family methyltransferase